MRGNLSHKLNLGMRLWPRVPPWCLRAIRSLQEAARNTVVIDRWPLRKLLIKFYLLPGMLQCQRYETSDLGKVQLSNNWPRRRAGSHLACSFVWHQSWPAVWDVRVSANASSAPHCTSGPGFRCHDRKSTSHRQAGQSVFRKWEVGTVPSPARSPFGLSSVLSKRAKITLERPKEEALGCCWVEPS